MAYQDLQELLNAFGLETHQEAIKLQLGIHSLWHLMMVSYRDIANSGLPPAVKGFLASLLFTPDHLRAIQDPREWTPLLTAATTSWRYGSEQNDRETEAQTPIMEQDRKGAQPGGTAGSHHDPKRLVTPDEKACRHKMHGNQQHSFKNYTGAVQHYTLAINILEKEQAALPPNLLLNRAVCHSAVCSWPLAGLDAARAWKILQDMKRGIDQGHSSTLSNERVGFLRIKALALKTRAEQQSGMEEESRVTLATAKKLGLHTRVLAALDHMQFMWAASACTAESKPERNRVKKDNKKAAKRKAGLPQEQAA
jgi:hypothetical protein